MIKRGILSLIAIACLLAGLLAVSIAFGTAAAPKPMDSVSAPFKQVDFRDLPNIEILSSRDGSILAYRSYPASGNSVAVLVHGSAGNSISVHALSKALQAAGINVYAIDVRGHGASGPHGDIAYVGQLDDDLVDFQRAARSWHPGAKIALIGFSAGGGYVLRVAGGSHGKLFDNYVLISPFLRYDAANQRPNSGGWAAPYIPRLIVLGMLDRLGIHCFEGLPVVAFAVQPDMEESLTPHYSYRLARNFLPDDDFMEDFRQTTQPMAVLAGGSDEVFFTDRLAPLIHSVRQDIPVILVPNLGHVDMTVRLEGLNAVVAAVLALQKPEFR